MEREFIEIDNLKNIILFLFAEIKKAELKGATAFRTLKLLYELKRELPVDHPLNESMPFYWYLHGPFSEPIRGELNDLDGECLTKEIYNGNTLLFKLNPKIDVQGIEYDPNVIDSKVQKIVANLVKSDNFYSIEKTVYNHAPYQFMSLYKLDLWESIVKYEESVNMGKEDSDLIENAIKLGYKCEARLPFENYYSRYEDLFSEFLTSLDRINRNEMSSNYSNYITKEMKKVWCTFGYGVRVKHYEPYLPYQNKVSIWDNNFKSELNKLNSDIDKFSKIASKSSKGEKVKFSDTSKKILSATLGTYVDCDTNGQI